MFLRSLSLDQMVLREETLLSEKWPVTQTGDQMSVEQMESNFRTFFEDNWDSYGQPACKLENRTMLERMWSELGRPDWFVAYEEGADMQYDIPLPTGTIVLELTVDKNGMPVDITFTNRYNKKDDDPTWHIFLTSGEYSYQDDI